MRRRRAVRAVALTSGRGVYSLAGRLGRTDAQDSYLASAHRYEQQLETSLTRRVKEWEDRLTPLLSEQESRAVFDVHRYSGRVLDNFVDRGLKPGTSLTLDAVAGPEAPVYEVIRLFMATLHLVC